MAFNAGSIVAQLEMNSRNFNDGIMSARTQVKSLSDETATMGDKIASVGKGIGATGKTMTMGLTLPIVGIGVASAKTAGDFEKSMSEVRAISGATGDDFDALVESAQELGATTAFSAREASEGMKYLAMAGMDTNAIIASMPGLLDLASASGTDLGTTADIVSDALTAFGLEADETGRLADVMAVASAKANTNVQMLGESYKYVAPIAGAMNYSIEDTTAVLGVMANSGIKASQAGTTLRTAILKLNAPTDAGAMWMEKLGLEMANADGTMRPLADVIEDMQKSMAGLTDQEKALASEAMFGKTAIAGMLAVINDDAGAFTALNGELDEAGGSAKEMSAIMLDNLAGSMTLLKSALEGMAISIGTILIPMIKTVAEKINEWVTSFNNLDDKTKKVIVQIGLFIAVLGPILMVVGKIMALFKVFMVVIKGLWAGLKILGGVLKGLTVIFKVFGVIAKGIGVVIGLLTTPIGLVVVAVGALIAIFVYLWKTNEDFRDAVIAIWEFIKESAIKIFTAIADFFKWVWEGIKMVIEAIWNGIKAFWERWGESITAYFTFLWDTLKLLVETVMNIIKGVIDVILGIITGDWERAWDGVKTIFKAFYDWIVHILGALLTFWKELWGAIFDAIAWIWDKIIMGVIRWLGDVLGAIFGKAGEFLSAGKGAFQSVWDGMKGIWGGISSWVGDKVSWLVDKLAFWRKGKKEMEEEPTAEEQIAGYNAVMGSFNRLTAPQQKPANDRGYSGYAKGTRDAEAGWHWVGENGPELMRFNGGETVLPNDISMAVATSTGGGANVAQGILDTTGIERAISALASQKPTEFNVEIKDVTVRQESDIEAVSESVFRKVKKEMDRSTDVVLEKLRKEARV